VLRGAGCRTVQTRTLTSTTVITYAYGAANRLVNVDGVDYTWDANGNLLSDGVRTFTYDAANRLTSVTSGTVTTTFEYDGLGNRTAQTVDGVTTEYVLDVGGGLPEVIVATTGGSSIYYVQVQGQVLARQDSGAWTHILPDHLGSVRQLVGSDSQVDLAQSFDPFGVRFETSGSGESDFGYTGEWWNSEAGLLYLRARYYDPAAGRFIGRDSWPGVAEEPSSLFPSYLYGSDNPVSFTDPTGLYVWFDIRPWRNQWKHERIERWFEQEWVGGGFWKAHLEFDQMPGTRMRPDIIYFPTLANPISSEASSPIDFTGVPVLGELYEIEPMYPDKALEGMEQLIQYFANLTVSGWVGGLHGILPSEDERGTPTAPFAGKRWSLNNVNWGFGTTLDTGPHTVPMQGQGDIWLVRPIPGLILYVDDNVRRAYAAVGITLGVASLEDIARQILQSGMRRTPSPAPTCFPVIVLPEFLLDPANPYNPLNCPDFPNCGAVKG
jgi:RHS repeat-associated protein